jgi:hypothetical protein
MKKWSLILLIGLVACNQQRKTQRYLFEHPEFTAEVCAENFPDKPDSVIVKTDTVIEIIFMDSLVFNTDTLYRDSLGFKYRTVTKVVTKTIRKDSIIYRENKAEQERLNLMLIDCQKNNNVLLSKLDEKDMLIASWKKKAKDRWLWIALLIGGAAAFTAFKIFKPKLPFKI